MAVPSSRTTGSSGGADGKSPYSTNRVYTDDQGYTYEIFYDPQTGQEFLGASINSSENRYNAPGYDTYTKGGNYGGASSAPPPPPASGGAGGGYPQGSYVPPPPASGSYGGGGGGGYAAGPTYANGQASRIPTGPPPPPPTTTGFPRSDWSRSMGGAIGNFDPNAVPPNMAIPRPLPSAGGIPQPGYKPSNIPAYQKKPGT